MGLTDLPIYVWHLALLSAGVSAQSGGGYALGGTAGQPDAGVLSGGAYTLGGGFWCGGAALYRIYLPLTLRGF